MSSQNFNANIVTTTGVTPPPVEIFSYRQDKFYSLYRTEKPEVISGPNVIMEFGTMINLPPNETNEPIIYKFELFFNRVATGIIANISVHPEDWEIEINWEEMEATFSEFIIVDKTLSSEGGLIEIKMSGVFNRERWGGAQDINASGLISLDDEEPDPEKVVLWMPKIK